MARCATGYGRIRAWRLARPCSGRCGGLFRTATMRRFLDRECDIHMAPASGKRASARHSITPVSVRESDWDAQKRQKD